MCVIFVFYAHRINARVEPLPSASRVTTLLMGLLGAAATHVDPRLAEEGAGAEHERDVDESVYWVHRELISYH